VTGKQELLKPHLLESIARLKKFVELDAPGVVVGAEAFNVFATTLAAFGDGAGSTFIQHIRERNLHVRGVCNHQDCTRYAGRPGLGLCDECAKALDLVGAEEVL